MPNFYFFISNLYHHQQDFLLLEIIYDRNKNLFLSAFKILLNTKLLNIPMCSFLQKHVYKVPHLSVVYFARDVALLYTQLYKLPQIRKKVSIKKKKKVVIHSAIAMQLPAISHLPTRKNNENDVEPFLQCKRFCIPGPDFFLSRTIFAPLGRSKRLMSGDSLSKKKIQSPGDVPST
jgi:hypothetical protein